MEQRDQRYFTAEDQRAVDDISDVIDTSAILESSSFAPDAILRFDSANPSEMFQGGRQYRRAGGSAQVQVYLPAAASLQR